MSVRWAGKGIACDSHQSELAIRSRVGLGRNNARLKFGFFTHANYSKTDLESWAHTYRSRSSGHRQHFRGNSRRATGQIMHLRVPAGRRRLTSMRLYRNSLLQLTACRDFEVWVRLIIIRRPIESGPTLALERGLFSSMAKRKQTISTHLVTGKWGVYVAPLSYSNQVGLRRTFGCEIQSARSNTILQDTSRLSSYTGHFKSFRDRSLRCISPCRENKLGNSIPTCLPQDAPVLT